MTPSVPPVLYKYMPTRRMDFFSAPKLRFTPPDEFNDIFDCQLRTQGLSTKEQCQKLVFDRIDEDFDTLIPEQFAQYTGLPVDVFRRSMTPQIKKILKKAFAATMPECVEAIAEQVTSEHFMKMLQAANENALKKARVGILCLTPDHKNTIMWGNYAVNERGQGNMGFVVGFDTSHVFFHRKKHDNDFFRHLVPVSYPSERPRRHLCDYASMENGGETLARDLYYTKDYKWASEEEWRMALDVPDNPQNKVFGLEDVPIEMITEVHLGARSANDLRKTAMDFCRQHDIPLFHMLPTVNGVLEPKPLLLA